MVAYLTIVAPLALRGQQSEPGPYSVAAVRAFLYFNQKDSVSANIIDNPSLHDFFNAPTGGRPPGSPSEEILITVEIAGERNGYASDRRLHLSIKEADGTVVLDRRPRIGLLGENGKWFETFVAYETGCYSLLVRAEIFGQKDSSAVEKRIVFRCGE